MLEQQRSIEKPVTVSGIGLHTGNHSTLAFLPAPANRGIWFRRIDMEGKPEIKADIDHVVDIARGTTIGQGDLRIYTVEHVLAALAGLMIDNVIVELNANEPPVLDGSAKPFVEALKSAGIVQQDSPRDYFVLEKTIAYSEENRGVDIVVFPSDEFRITFMVDYKNPALGTQYTSMYSLRDEFETEFAPARTFCFLHEVEELHRQGLIKGGTLDNAIVIIDRKVDHNEIDSLKKLLAVKNDVKIGTSGIMNSEPLRFKNEPVRHKALDLIGDLALLGVPLKAHVIAARSGHAANVALVKMLRKEYEKYRISSKFSGEHKGGDVVFSAKSILQILPHRYPFLLVDKIIDLIPRERVVGIKNVTLNEPYFAGHFPGHPIMPGVLILEAMAQVGGILLLNTEQNPDEKLVYFTGLDKVKFRKPVVPGDQIRFEIEMIKFRKTYCRMAGKAYVAGDLVCEAELAAAVVDR